MCFQQIQFTIWLQSTTSPYINSVIFASSHAKLFQMTSNDKINFKGKQKKLVVLVLKAGLVTERNRNRVTCN